jgi:hypothetical protein
MPITCDISTLTKSAACFMPQCMGEDEREAISVVTAIYDLAASGGTDYTRDLSAGISQLGQDATCWSCLSKGERQAITTELDYESALADGASFPADKTLKQLAKPFVVIGKERRAAILLYLKCALATYDQGIP